MRADGPRGDGGRSEKDSARRKLETGRLESGLSYQELWWRQIAIGGDATPLELEAYILGLLPMEAHQHDLIAQALNEYFLEQGQDHPMPYSEPWMHDLRWD